MLAQKQPDLHCYRLGQISWFTNRESQTENNWFGHQGNTIDALSLLSLLKKNPWGQLCSFSFSLLGVDSLGICLHTTAGERRLQLNAKRSCKGCPELHGTHSRIKHWALELPMVGHFAYNDCALNMLKNDRNDPQRGTSLHAYDMELWRWCLIYLL